MPVLSIHMSAKSVIRPICFNNDASRVLLARGALSLAVVLTGLAGLIPGPAAAQNAPTTTVQIHGPVQTNPQRDLGDWVLEAVQLAGAGVAVIGLWFVAGQLKAANAASKAAADQSRQLNEQNRHAQADARIQRTVAFQDRFTRQDFGAVHARVQAFLEVDDARRGPEAPSVGKRCAC